MAKRNPFGGKRRVPYGPGATPSGKPPNKRGEPAPNPAKRKKKRR